MTISATDMPAQADGQWKDAYSSAGRLSRDGEHARAAEKIDEAWELMPEPKLLCSRAHLTLVRRVKLYGLAERYGEGIALAEWAVANSPRQNVDAPIFLVLKGGLLLDSSRPEEAFVAFDAAWEIAGEYGFDDDQTRYLEFYQSRKDAGQ